MVPLWMPLPMHIRFNRGGEQATNQSSTYTCTCTPGPAASL